MQTKEFLLTVVSADDVEYNEETFMEVLDDNLDKRLAIELKELNRKED